jgi:hypothetical protein
MDEPESRAEKMNRLARTVSNLIAQLRAGGDPIQLRERLIVTIMISPTSAEEGAGILKQFDQIDILRNPDSGTEEKSPPKRAFQTTK